MDTKILYLDNAATTPLDPDVLEDMMPYLTTNFYNPGSPYVQGVNVGKAIEKARKQVADSINADPSQIIFTSGGTESNNMIFNGISDFMRQNHKNHVIISEIEHDSVINSAKILCTKQGFDLSIIPPDKYGCISVADIVSAIRDTTGLVSVMHINNETGSENDIEKICSVCHDRGALFHTDCVQSFGYKVIDVDRIGCDFISISSHKINGPKGAGAVYAKDVRLLSPLVYGGKEQESGMRGGTINVASVVGFGSACSRISNTSDTTISKLSNEICRGIFEEADDLNIRQNIRINGMPPEFDRKTTSVTILGVDSETLVLALSSIGILVSSGSACNGRGRSYSRVLKSMGLSVPEAGSTIRITPGAGLDETAAYNAGKRISRMAHHLIYDVYI